MAGEIFFAGIVELQELLAGRQISLVELVDNLIQRIADLDQSGPRLNSVLEINTDARSTAAQLDSEREAGETRGPLHGVPVMLKGNIGTADEMETTAGSLALKGYHPADDAVVAARLRKAGAVILAKTNLSEWANFRSEHSSSGWSGLGGQCGNPYAIDRSPGGSSSGSGAAVAAGFAPCALGTETDGSIVNPSSFNGVVGLKPTVGLTRRDGVIPIAHSQDSIGPMGRSVEDVAAILTAIAEPTNSGPIDYRGLLAEDGLHGARIGVARDVYFGYSASADAVIERAIDLMRRAGAVVIDPANIGTGQAMAASQAEIEVLLYEFKTDLNEYLARARPPSELRSLEDIIAFNIKHADREMPYFGQELLERAQAKGPLSDAAYKDALDENHRLSRAEGIDATLREHRLEAIIAPGSSPSFPIDLVNGDHFTGGCSQPAALAGYPIISVPAGMAFGLPVGLCFMASSGSEGALLRLAHAFEHIRGPLPKPDFRPTLAGPRAQSWA